jgi:hypothetical protein
MKTLLFVSHAPSANTQRLADRCFAEINAHSEKITAIHKNSQKVASQDGLACDGLKMSYDSLLAYNLLP